MFKRRTLFVIGAGASQEVGFPVGSQLAATIKQKMDILLQHGRQPIDNGADYELYAAVTSKRQIERPEFQQAAWLIRDGITLTRSIDDFMDLHRENERLVLLGKAAIVKSILEAERESSLYVDPSDGREFLDMGAIANTWFVKFMQVLGRGVQKENVEHLLDNVSFVVFNYDRCIEHFLLYAIKAVYGLTRDQAYEIVRRLDIIHPYGTLPGAPFGIREHYTYDYAALASEIKTYTEQVSDPKILDNLSRVVSLAECVVFLGFAYHSQNMRLLKATSLPNRVPVFGTAYGMSKADVEVVEQQILDLFAPARAHRIKEKVVQLENGLRSFELFDWYSKSLSGGD
jgi:hypothetical protein